jgi:hypothetical protein
MPKRTDANQQLIMDTLRKAGATVQTLHEVGRGVPDLLVSYSGATLLLEVKVPGKKPNAKQIAWRQAWQGETAVVTTPLEALAALRIQAAPILHSERNRAQAGRPTPSPPTSPTLKRLIEEVRTERSPEFRGYDRVYNRHHRS